MKKYFFILLLIACQLTVSAQQRRPIDSQHPLWMIHIDVWNQADPQKIIDLVPDDIKPYVCMNLSFSCAYDKDLGIHHKPQNAILTYKSWASVCQANNMWFCCQPASGGHTHILENDLETFEYFFKQYPNFLGWNYAEQFWGFDETGDKYSSSATARLELFAKLVEMSHKYGGFLTVSYCGSIYHYSLTPTSMMKREPKLLAACKKYPEAILWLYKYTHCACFYTNESSCFGPFVSGLANNYGVRYDNCGYNDGLNNLYGDNHGRKYPNAAGIGTVMEQTCQNGGAVWDGPELIWREECFQNLYPSTNAAGYTQRNWGRYPSLDNIWIDMFRKIIDGTLYIPTRDEVISKIKYIVHNDYNDGDYAHMGAMWDDAFDNLYNVSDPFNRYDPYSKTYGHGNYNNWYLKSTGRYGTIPMTPDFNTGFKEKFPHVVSRSKYTTTFPTLAKKKELFDAAYPEESTGDLFVSRYKNQLITYTPYTYSNAKTTAAATIPLKYNTCDNLKLTYGKLSSGIIREFEDKIVFYLNNFRSDTTTTVLDQIVINGATAEPKYTYSLRAKATGSVTTSWDATNKKYVINVKHNGPVDLTVECKGNATDRATDAIAIKPLEAPSRPEEQVRELIVEAEDMDYKGVSNVVTDQYANPQFRSVRGHSGMGFVTFGNNTAASLRKSIQVKKEASYNGILRYSNPTGEEVTVKYEGHTSRAGKYFHLEPTAVNEWKKAVVTADFRAGTQTVTLTNTGGKNVYIDQFSLVPADMEAEKFGIFLRKADNGSVSCDVTEAEEGTKVKLNVTPDEGYELIGWNIIHGKITIDEDDSFIMPDDNVTVQPIFKYMYLVYDAGIASCYAGTLPQGWETNEGEGNSVHSYPNQYGSGSRIMIGFNGTYGKGLYWRVGEAKGGTQSAYPITLEPGKYKLIYAVAAWKGSPTYKAQVLTKTGTALASSTSYTAAPNANGSTSANLSSAVERTLEFTVPRSGDYVVKFSSVSGGYSEYLLLDCRIDKVPEATEITEAVLGAEAGKCEIYDITGKRLPSLQRGMNIIRKGGMDVRKIFIK